MVFEAGSEEYRLLYCDDDGELIYLDEVQLLDPVPVDRIPPLRELLTRTEPSEVYSVTQVLAAWGDEEGLASVRRLIEENVHEHTNLDPHRLTGRDEVYDKLAEALAVAVGVQHVVGAKRDLVMQVALLFLARFEQHHFDSGLVRLLLRLADPALNDSVVAAMDRAWADGQHDQASDLLAPLMKTNPELGQFQLQRFVTDAPMSRRVAMGITNAVGYAQTPENLELVERLGQDPDLNEVVSTVTKYRWPYLR